MAIKTPYLREQLALAYQAEATHASLHTADPGETGASELTGSTGTGPYARQPLTWTAGIADGVITAGTVSFEVPAGTNLTHVGIWSAVTGGQFLDAQDTLLTFENDGTYQVSLSYTQA